MSIRVLKAANPGPFTLDGTRTYLVGETIVIDPGPDLPAHVDAIVAGQPHLELILITHRHADHAPAAVALKLRTGAKIFAPAGVLGEGLVDRLLEDGDGIVSGGVSLRTVATPGHTREHVCFLTDEGALFTGDTVLGFGTTTIFPPDGNMGDYLRSLRRLRDLSPRVIYPGHGPIREDAVELIDEYIAHREKREQQIERQLLAGAMTARDLREAIYPDLDSSLHGAAEIQMNAHLEHMRSRGAVRQEGSAWVIG